MASVGELFISLGFDVDEAKLRNFGDGIINLRNDMGLLAGAAAGAVYGIDKFISTPIESATALENLADLLGVSAEAIQKWEYAANAANPLFSREAAGESIKNIQSVFAAIASGSSNAPTNSFLAMGLGGDDARRMNALQFLTYVRQHFDEILARENLLHAGRGLQFMQQDLQALGVAGGMWQMLRENKEDFDKAMASADSQNAQLEQNKKILQSINDMSQAWDNFKMKLVAGQKDNLIGGISLIQEHADNLRTTFQSIADEWNTIPNVVKGGLEAVGAGIALFIAAWVAPATAAVLALIAALDYIGNYEKHKDSQSAEHVDQINELRAYFKGDRKKSLWDIIMRNGGGSKDYGVPFDYPRAPNTSLDDFKTAHQVEIDRINAKGAFFAKNPGITNDNQSGLDRDIRKFEQTNHFNIQTEQFDENTIKILVRELEDSVHNITQSQIGNDPQ